MLSVLENLSAHTYTHATMRIYLLAMTSGCPVIDNIKQSIVLQTSYLPEYYTLFGILRAYKHAIILSSYLELIFNALVILNIRFAETGISRGCVGAFLSYCFQRV